MISKHVIKFFREIFAVIISRVTNWFPATEIMFIPLIGFKPASVAGRFNSCSLHCCLYFSQENPLRVIVQLWPVPIYEGSCLFSIASCKSFVSVLKFRVFINIHADKTSNRIIGFINTVIIVTAVSDLNWELQIKLILLIVIERIKFFFIVWIFIWACWFKVLSNGL